jgi:hypothetical protein
MVFTRVGYVLLLGCVISIFCLFASLIILLIMHINLNCSFIQVGFKMFLGVTASVTNWDAEGTCCSIVLEDNPLVDFVELPDNYQGLYYCNILSGVIRGALDMVSFYFLSNLTHTLLIYDSSVF